MTTEREALQANLDAILTIPADAFNRATRDRIGGSDLAAMRRSVLATCNGVCASCGLTVNTNEGGSSAVWGHLIPATYHGGKGGWIEGNVTIMCKTCNDDAKDMVFTADMLARPDIALIPWPVRNKALREAFPASNREKECRSARSW